MQVADEDDAPEAVPESDKTKYKRQKKAAADALRVDETEELEEPLSAFPDEDLSAFIEDDDDFLAREEAADAALPPKKQEEEEELKFDSEEELEEAEEQVADAVAPVEAPVATPAAKKLSKKAEGKQRRIDEAADAAAATAAANEIPFDGELPSLRPANLSAQADFASLPSRD